MIDPQKNLAFIIQECGLSQASICQRIAERGYSVARATINRWANPQKRNKNFTYNPVIMLCLLEVCSENLIVPLRLEDVFAEGPVLKAKLQSRKSYFEPFPKILASAARHMTARHHSIALEGVYEAELPSPFMSNEFLAAEFEIRNEDDIKFEVACSVTRGCRDAGPEQAEQFSGSGTMLVWDAKAIMTVEVNLDHLLFLTLHLVVSNRLRTADHLDGVIVMSRGLAGELPSFGHLTLQRKKAKNLTVHDTRAPELGRRTNGLKALPRNRRSAEAQP